MRTRYSSIGFILLISFLSSCYLIQFSDAMVELTIGRRPHEVVDLQGFTSTESDFKRDSLTGLSRPRAQPFKLRPGSTKRSTVPMSAGLSVGSYFGPVTIAGQTYTMTLDTGSFTPYVGGTGCQVYQNLTNGPLISNCNSSDPYAALPTSGAISCSYAACVNYYGAPDCNNTVCQITNSYGDGSGVIALGYNASVSFGGYTAQTFVGYVWKSTPSFAFDQFDEDGLVGLGFQATSLGGTETIIDALIYGGMPAIFAMYLNPSGGSLTLGGYNTQYTSGGITYTPLLGTGYYIIATPASVIYGSTTVPCSPTGIMTIVDSGTTLLVLPTSHYNAVYNAISATGDPAGILSGYCLTAYPDLTAYPTFIFPIDSSLNLTLTPNQYVLNYSSSTGICFGLGFQSTSSNVLIFGDTLMNAYYSIFDIANNRMGFAPISALTPSENVPAFAPVATPVAPPVAPPHAGPVVPPHAGPVAPPHAGPVAPPVASPVSPPATTPSAPTPVNSPTAASPSTTPTPVNSPSSTSSPSAVPVLVPAAPQTPNGPISPQLPPGFTSSPTPTSHANTIPMAQSLVLTITMMMMMAMMALVM